jgi:hypothetical protein
MYSKGISWFDDCRIPFVDEKDPSKERYKSYRNVDALYGGYGDTHYEYKEQTGRFPANLLVSDDMLNDGVISKSVSGGKGKPIPRQDRMAEETITERGGFNDKGTNSRYYDIDKWFNNLIDV